MTELLHKAIIAAIKAGNRICEIYETDFEVIIKQDYSPVTLADKEANDLIELELASTDIPVLGEEGEQIDYSNRKKYNLLWIVDPLDGTKEFVKRNGEFTVNIGLSQNGIPVLGVIFSPVFRDLYFSSLELGSFKIDRHIMIQNENFVENWEINQFISNANKLPIQNLPDTYTVIASRSHHNPELKRYLRGLESQKKVNTIYSGSSIKMCWVAEGIAHEYPRFGRTMEWDTCAGHAILKNAGGKIIQVDTGEDLKYNKEDIANPSFIAQFSS